MGVEWGWRLCRKVHRAFLRGLLRVKRTTLSKAVLGEFGRFPVVVRRWEQTFRFVNRTLGLPEDRLARLALEESKAMWAAGERGWFAEIVEKAQELVCDGSFARGFDIRSHCQNLRTCKTLGKSMGVSTARTLVM